MTACRIVSRVNIIYNYLQKNIIRHHIRWLTHKRRNVSLAIKNIFKNVNKINGSNKFTSVWKTTISLQKHKKSLKELIFNHPFERLVFNYTFRFFNRSLRSFKIFIDKIELIKLRGLLPAMHQTSKIFIFNAFIR